MQVRNDIIINPLLAGFLFDVFYRILNLNLLAMNPITFTTQLDYKTYMKIAFQQYYQRWQIKAVYILFVYVSLVAIFASDSKRPVFSLSIDFITAIAFTFILYLKARMIYKSTPNAGQERHWLINDNGIEVKGNSSSFYAAWSEIFKITDSKKWIFIWFNKMQSYAIPKEFISHSEFLEINNLIISNKSSIANT